MLLPAPQPAASTVACRTAQPLRGLGSQKSNIVALCCMDVCGTGVWPSLLLHRVCKCALQDLKCFVFSLISAHFKIQPIQK